MTPEERNNITKLSALCSITKLYIQGCFKTIQDANIQVLKQKYSYDSLSSVNKRFVDKKIMKDIANLNLTVQATTTVLNRIELSMRNTLSDEVTDALIDKIDAVLDDINLDEILKCNVSNT